MVFPGDSGALGGALGPAHGARSLARAPDAPVAALRGGPSKGKPPWVTHDGKLLGTIGKYSEAL